MRIDMRCHCWPDQQSTISMFAPAGDPAGGGFFIGPPSRQIFRRSSTSRNGLRVPLLARPAVRLSRVRLPAISPSPRYSGERAGVRGFVFSIGRAMAPAEPCPCSGCHCWLVQQCVSFNFLPTRAKVKCHRHRRRIRRLRDIPPSGTGCGPPTAAPPRLTSNRGHPP